MTIDRLDCALYECDQCADVIGREYGCCCGRIGPDWDEYEDWDEEGEA
jgi:hypothetical protein